MSMVRWCMKFLPEPKKKCESLACYGEIRIAKSPISSRVKCGYLSFPPKRKNNSMSDVPRCRTALQSIVQWFCPPSETENLPEVDNNRIDWIRAIPFIAMHLACFGVFFVSFSWLALTIAVFLYALRVFTLTGRYHRYFSHRTFKTWRI